MRLKKWWLLWSLIAALCTMTDASFAQDTAAATSATASPHRPLTLPYPISSITVACSKMVDTFALAPYLIGRKASPF